jgi:lauroyl/myristoyl acyltransferase
VVTVEQRQLKVSRRPLVSKEDIFFCAELPLLWLIAWLMPERAWRGVCYRLERFKSALHIFSPKAVATIAARVLPQCQRDEDAWSFSLRHAATRTEHHLQILRELRPGGWKPRLVLRGAEHLRHALEAGNGAVLWIAHFSFNALATKKALSDAGFKVWHLSRPEHGFSKSRFGIRCLNPIRVAAELRYLGGRIVIDRADPPKAKRAAERVLRENGIISITAGAWEGRKIALPALLGGRIEIATGAPDFSCRCNSPLLPVFTLRDDAAREISVIIDRPLSAPTEQDPVAALHSMTQEFIDRMAPLLLAHPDQWRDWKNLKMERPHD